MFTSLTLAIAAMLTPAVDAPTLEIVVYRVKDPGNFPAIQLAAHKRLTALDGYMRSVTLRSANDPNRFADIVLWSSLKAAERAAQLMEKHPDMMPFMQAIEGVQVFAHVQPTTGATRLPPALKGAQVLELAVSKVPDAERFVTLQRGIHQHLSHKPVVLSSSPLRSLKGDGLFIDMLTWTDQPSAHAIGEQMMANPEFKPFFAAAGGPPVLFDFFVETTAR